MRTRTVICPLVIERALDLLIEQARKYRFGQTKSPRHSGSGRVDAEKVELLAL